MKGRRYLEAYYWILAFQVAFELIMLAKERDAARRAAREALDLADEALEHANRKPERIFVVASTEEPKPEPEPEA